MYNVFVYGTLRSARVRDNVMGTEDKYEVLEDSYALGYTIHPVQGAGFPATVPSTKLGEDKEDDDVEGEVLVGINERQMQALIRYESGLYDMVDVEVETRKGQVNATMFVAGPPLEGRVVLDDKWRYSEWKKAHE